MKKAVSAMNSFSFICLFSIWLPGILFFTLTVATAFSIEPVEIRSGHVTGVEMTVDEVKKINLNELLLKRRFAATDKIDESAVRLRPPDAGKAYLILEMSLKEGRSIGKYDYRVQFRGQDQVHRCIAMARGNDAFDPRLWEVTAENSGLKPVRLLFETDEAEGEVEVLLVPDLGLTITPETVTFKIEGATLE